MTAGALGRAARCGQTAVCTALLLAASACVTTYEPAPLFLSSTTAPPPPSYAVAVAIPIPQGNGTPEDIARAEFYRSVLKRLHDAAKDGDVHQLESLLAAYQREDMPPAIAEHVASYRAVVHGLRFQQHVASVATLPLVDERDEVTAAPPLGANVALELRVPAGAEAWTLGGRDDDDPLRFVVAIRIDDTFVDGSARSWESQDFVPLPAAFELRGDAVLRAPIAVDLPGGEAVRREVRVLVELMPGYLRHAGVRAPLRRTLLATTRFTQWPVGYDAVAAAPLASLQAALRAFEPASFRRAYLAAVSTEGPDREMALGLLVQQVRFGRIDQAQVAMAALREMTRADVAIGDRDGWLAWDQARR